MKKIVPLLFALFAITQCRAGWDLTFCTQLDSTGKCPPNNAVFGWDGDKASIHAMVANADGMGTAKLSFKVFDMKNDHTGELYAELRATTRPEWKQATKRMYFVKPGYYKVEVYDEANNRLITSYLTITERN